jgi:hypothetical protein
VSEPERGCARDGTAAGRVFGAMPVFGSRPSVTVTGAALAAGLLIVAWEWRAGAGLAVPGAVAMLALLAGNAARAPVDYRLVGGPVVVVHRRLLPDVSYRVTDGVEGFNDLEALRRRNQPSGTLLVSPVDRQAFIDAVRGSIHTGHD